MELTVYRCDPEHRSRGCGAIAFFDPTAPTRRRKCPNCGKVACYGPVAYTTILTHMKDEEVAP